MEEQSDCAHVIRTFFVLLAYYSIGDKLKGWNENTFCLDDCPSGLTNCDGDRRGIVIFVGKFLSLSLLFKNYFKVRNNLIDYLVNSLVMKVKNMTQKHEMTTCRRLCDKLWLQWSLGCRIAIRSVSFHWQHNAFQFTTYLPRKYIS